jgi:SAM-dependent methyltransferase
LKTNRAEPARVWQESGGCFADVSNRTWRCSRPSAQLEIGMRSTHASRPTPAAECGVELPEPFSIEDEKFDQIYPPEIRELSAIFWTPVAVAAEAAKLLAADPNKHVLDVGCGAGKFCIVAALLTEGRFTGVEQRSSLVEAARQAARARDVGGVEFIHANITDVPFAAYDAFYIFNPFEEHLHGHKIDKAVALSAELFKRYTSYVSDQLGRCPLGTRVVTYMGYADDIPACYDCEATFFGDDLKLWIKRREYDPTLEALALRPRRSYRGSHGWAPPRR